HRLRGRALAEPATALLPGRRPCGLRAGHTFIVPVAAHLRLSAGMDQRSLAILEFPLVRERLAAATSFAPGRHLAETLEPSNDPVIVARGLDETEQARSMLIERPGVGIGAAHDIGPWIERAARGGRLDPAPFPGVPRTPAAGSRPPPSPAAPRHPPPRGPARGSAGRSCATLARSSTRCRRCGARWRAASIPPGSSSTP